MLRQYSKGMGTGTILKLTLALMTASLFISAGTVGSLGNAIIDGFGNIGENTDYTIDITDSNPKQKLSNASKYVYDRARNDGCAEDSGVDQQIQNGGYPELSNTYIGREPDCTAGSSGLMRGFQGGVQQLGKDQEGVYSRVGFEVTTEEVTLSSNGGTWLENRLWGGARGTLNENSVSECNPNSLQEALAAGAAGFAAGSALPVIGSTAGFAVASIGATVSSAHFVGTADNFVVFFEPDEMDNRVNGWLNEYQQLNGKMYCFSLTEAFGADYLNGNTHAIEQGFADKYPSGFRMTLCRGDKGYIQMNKGKPQNNGEAGESIAGSAYNYPHIVITEKGDSCGDITNAGSVLPSGSSATGNMFFVSIDAGNAYADSTPNSWSLWDDREGANIDAAFSEGGATDDITAPYDSVCRVGLIEDDGIVGDDGDGYVDFNQGTVIEKLGTFPALGSSQIEYRASEVANEDEGGNVAGDPKNTYHVYQNLVDNGFDGQSINGEYPYLKGTDPQHTLELKGDMLCANPGSFSYSKWIMCDPSAPVKEVTINGNTYQCNEEDGDWTQ